jgi:hypothetical protein
MAHALYKVTITDHDYHYTRYTTWVSATSKNQAIVVGAARIGGEMTRREWLRMGREPVPETLLEPDVKLELISVDEYYQHHDTVEVSE